MSKGDSGREVRAPRNAGSERLPARKGLEPRRFRGCGSRRDGHDRPSARARSGRHAHHRLRRVRYPLGRRGPDRPPGRRHPARARLAAGVEHLPQHADLAGRERLRDRHQGGLAERARSDGRARLRGHGGVRVRGQALELGGPASFGRDQLQPGRDRPLPRARRTARGRLSRGWGSSSLRSTPKPAQGFSS